MIKALACPVCHQQLHEVPGGVRCDHGHSFDRARQGYLNLLGRKAGANADTPAMVQARLDFLQAGHYRPISPAVVAALPELGDGRVLDVGAGPGWYLRQVLQANPSASGLAADISVAAIRRAARAHERAEAMVCDVWKRLPLPDGALDALTCIFAPRNGAEFARVLRPGATMVVATPQPDHLTELVTSLGLLEVAPDKQRSLDEQFGSWFEQVECTPVRHTLDLERTDVANLVAMGPNAFHEHDEPRAARVTMAVEVRRMVRRDGGA